MLCTTQFVYKYFNIVIDSETNKEINRCDNTHMRPGV